MICSFFCCLPMRLSSLLGYSRNLKWKTASTGINCTEKRSLPDTRILQSALYGTSTTLKEWRMIAQSCLAHRGMVASAGSNFYGITASGSLGEGTQWGYSSLHSLFSIVNTILSSRNLVNKGERAGANCLVLYPFVFWFSFFLFHNLVSS